MEQTKNNTLTKKEFKEIRKIVIPLTNRLHELSITYEDVDTNERFGKARGEISQLLTELWYKTKD